LGKTEKSKQRKLKASWQITDIPWHIKATYLWPAMKNASTYTSWQQELARMNWNQEDEKYLQHVKTSRETYTSLKDELLEMPVNEIDKLPSDIRSWILDIRKPPTDIDTKQNEETTNKEKLSDKAITHDIKIFTESDEILSEKDLRNIYFQLHSNQLYWDDGDKSVKFMWFFGHESNQYVTKELRNKCTELIDSLNELWDFVGIRFFPADGNARRVRSELWIPSTEEYKHNWDEETWGKYHNLEPELYKLADNTLEAYKNYRATIRELLYV
jgi:hypothetical protein